MIQQFYDTNIYKIDFSYSSNYTILKLCYFFFANEIFTKQSSMDINMDELLAEQDSIGWGVPDPGDSDDDTDSNASSTATATERFLAAVTFAFASITLRVSLAGG